MRKLFLSAMAVFLFCHSLVGQSISPFVLNSTGGTAKVNNKNFYLDWSVAEMTLVNTMHQAGYKGLIIVTNGFLQPPKDDAEGKDDEEPYYEYVKPEVNPQFRVYPNPAQSYITIDIPMQEAGKIKLTLYNSMGELVYQKEISTSGQPTRETISMAAYMQGTYLLRVQMGPPGLRAKEITYKIFKAN